MGERDYTIEPRPASLGGGWHLRMYADGVEMGGGVFQDHDEALAEATVWICEGGDDE